MHTYIHILHTYKRVCVHTHIHTYLPYIRVCIMHTYIPYIHTCVRTYIILIYVCAYIHTYLTYVCTYMHTYVCAYMQTYIHTYRTYIHTCVHTYIHTYILTLHTCVHTCIHTCVHTCKHTYIHTVHTYIRVCIYTYVHTCVRTYIHTYIHKRLPNYMGSNPRILHRQELRPHKNSQLFLYPVGAVPIGTSVRRYWRIFIVIFLATICTIWYEIKNWGILPLSVFRCSGSLQWKPIISPDGAERLIFIKHAVCALWDA